MLLWAASATCWLTAWNRSAACWTTSCWRSANASTPWLHGLGRRTTDALDRLRSGLGPAPGRLGPDLAGPPCRRGGLHGGLTGAECGGLALPLRRFLRTRLRLGPLALLPGGRAPLLLLVVPGLLGLGQAGLHLLGNPLHLLLAERLLHGREQLLRLVARVLAEGLAQLGELGGERLVILRQRVQLGHLRAQLLVVLDGGGDQIPGLGVLAQDREEVLLLKAHMRLELGLEFGEQPLTGLDCAVRGLGEAREQLVRLGRPGLHQGA